MKNKVWLGLASVAFLALAGCGSVSDEAQIFIYDGTDPFVQSLYAALTDDLRPFIGWKTYDAARKQTTQNDDFLKALDDASTRILIMNIVDRLASSALIEKAEKKGIPLIFINREPLSDDLKRDDWSKANCYYCGSDPAYEGELQGEIAADILGPTASFAGSKWDKNGDGIVQVAILKGELGHQDCEYRTKYCVSTLKDLGFNVEIVDIQYCDWERTKGYEAMKAIYDPTSAKPIELLFSNNDEMALGAIRYLEDYEQGIVSSSDESAASSAEISSSGEEPASSSSVPTPSSPFDERFFPIIGVDATADGKKAIEDGTLAGTVLNDSVLQAQVITSIARFLLFGEAIPSSYEEKANIVGNAYQVKGEKVTKNTI